MAAAARRWLVGSGIRSRTWLRPVLRTNVSATDNQHQPSDAIDERAAGNADQAAARGAPALGRPAHNVFLLTVLLIGGLMGVAAILVVWSLGKYL